MNKLSNLLKVYKTQHHSLGEVIELFSPKSGGGVAFFVERDADQNDTGVGLRLTKRTALKLAAALTKLAKESK